MEDYEENLKKVVKSVYEEYFSKKDVHEVAYLLNPEYKIFWDNHSEKIRKNFLTAQKANSLVEGTNKVREGIFHLATGGASYGIKKLFQIGKKSRKEVIEDAVTNKDFTELIKSLNCLLFDKKVDIE